MTVHSVGHSAIEATEIPSAVLEQTPAPGERYFGQTFAALRHRNYRLLWTGAFFMGAGQWIQQVTLGWLLYDLTGSSVLLGALNGLRAAPFLISGPIAGVLADRMDRKRLLLTAMAGFAEAHPRQAWAQASLWQEKALAKRA